MPEHPRSRRSRRSRALARLLRRREVRAFARVARNVGARAWLVGGAVRDACLGLPVPEIDAAIAGDAESAARALEAGGAGRAVFLSRERPGPRVYRVAGPRPLDIAEVEGDSIEADLARRDFTVNALAVPVDGGPGDILDPFGGLADLAKKRLHPVRAENIVDDPLRALRAARFLATHGLAPDRATLAAARRAAAPLGRVASERIAGELARILGSPRASPAMAWAAKAGLLPAALGLPLSPGRARAVARALASLDDAGTRRLPEQRRRRLRLAALALALGLPDREAGAWLSGRRLPRREADEAARLASLAGAAESIPPGDRRGAWRWVLGAGPFAADAARLASRRGRVRLAARLARLARLEPRRVDVGGKDVMLWLGIPAGPAVGALLRELAVAAAVGQVKTRREARDWLSVQVRETPSPAIISER